MQDQYQSNRFDKTIRTDVHVANLIKFEYRNVIPLWSDRSQISAYSSVWINTKMIKIDLLMNSQIPHVSVPYRIIFCSILNRYVHISILNSAFWDVGHMHCGNCELVLHGNRLITTPSLLLHITSFGLMGLASLAKFPNNTLMVITFYLCYMYGKYIE